MEGTEVGVVKFYTKNIPSITDYGWTGFKALIKALYS